MSAAQLKKFDPLQTFRGLAALGVVFHHVAISTYAFVGKISAWLNLLFELLVGVPYHLFIEKPLIRLFRQQSKRLGAA